jgi:hypothetical protein
VLNGKGIGRLGIISISPEYVKSIYPEFSDSIFPDPEI